MDLASLYRAHIKTLTEGFQNALEAESLDALLLHSGKLTKKSAFDDQYWSMRPVPMFEYWAAAPWPDCVVSVTRTGDPRLVVLRDNSFWERPREPDWSLIAEGLEIVEVANQDALVAALPSGAKTAFIGAQASDAAPFDVGAINPEGLVTRLHALRVRKTPYEVECMAEASRIAARGHAATQRVFEAGERSELAIHLAYLSATEQDDADTPYKNIVALGEACGILHHVYYRRAPEAKSLLVDAGASHRGYHSDITRTYAADGGLFSELLQRMETLQQQIVDEVEVGKPYEQLHDDAHHHIARALTELGIVTASPEAAVETGVTRKLFPHGLGHSLGIQVHDVGCRNSDPKPENPFLRNTTLIGPGQVFTIEPGVYFIDSLLADLKRDQADAVDWGKVEMLRPYGGIRIEDNVLVKETGIRNLTREAFASLAT